ncbi:MAG: UDP-N-acetylmuramate--L-alanine ligase, partial [Candidatus Sungbacteria bacterium]|nr:UDP-N-acetylmuramate--L-alanine ligase [Candidatus Sungbacteria bacterium]
MAAKKSTKWVYFIGIGGIGMSALARYYKARKWAVSGSDLAWSGITKELAKEGVKVKIGHKKGNLPAGLALVIYSQAIRSSNPELREARRRGVRVAPYPEIVGELTRTYTTIAVAGAHGKSTTTALASLVMIKGGLDPTVIVGAKLKEFGGKNFRAGHGTFLALEADEFGKSFLHYSPAFAIVTNIDNEHLDTYKNIANIKKNFLKFLGNTKIGGTLILNKSSKPLIGLKKKIGKIAEVKNLKIIWYSLRSPAARKIENIIKIPGKHNVSNALAAY